MMKCKTVFTAILFSLALICQTAYGLDLQSAKAQGIVGETASGYLAVVTASNPAAQNLVHSINSKRKQVYQNIAKKNNTPLANVEHLAGQKAIAKTPAGQFINTGGGWQKK